MTLGNKLAKLRKENNLTQEQLAELLGISRQAVSKWESDAAYPETEKLLRLSELYHCSLDYLLKDEPPQEPAREKPLRIHFPEKMSKKTLCGLPLWHIGSNAHGFFALGLRARGVFAMGFAARGVVAVGLAALGVVSFGSFSLGVVALGAFSAGLIALGAMALGAFAAGAIALGIVSLGGIAVGCFSVGGLALAQYAALGDTARAAIAVGKTEAFGTVYERTPPLPYADTQLIRAYLQENTPWLLGWARKLFELFL